MSEKNQINENGNLERSKVLGKMKDMLKKGVEERGLKEELTIIPIEFKGFYIDMPKKPRDMYHGSVYGILCNPFARLCKIKGDIVVEEDLSYNVTKILEESDCKVFNIHNHTAERKGQKYEESHVHFICEDKDKIDTISMINFLKDY